MSPKGESEVRPGPTRAFSSPLRPFGSSDSVPVVLWSLECSKFWAALAAALLERVYDLEMLAGCRETERLLCWTDSSRLSRLEEQGDLASRRSDLADFPTLTLFSKLPRFRDFSWSCCFSRTGRPVLGLCLSGLSSRGLLSLFWGDRSFLLLRSSLCPSSLVACLSLLFPLGSVPWSDSFCRRSPSISLWRRSPNLSSLLNPSARDR